MKSQLVSLRAPTHLLKEVRSIERQLGCSRSQAIVWLLEFGLESQEMREELASETKRIQRKKARNSKPVGR